MQTLPTRVTTGLQRAGSRWCALVYLSALACGGTEGGAADAVGSETEGATPPPASAAGPSAGAAAAGSEPSGADGSAAPGSEAQPPAEGMTAAGVRLDTSTPTASAGTPSSAAPAANAGAADPAEGSQPVAVDTASLPAVTLHLAGDSTVMKYAADSAQEGWGQELEQLFIDKVSFDNLAIGGASVASFHTSRWNTIVSRLKAGDFVMAAFGANDSGFTADRHVDPPDFKALFSQMADEVASKDATFILVTPSALQEWRDGKEGNVRLGPYVNVLRELGQMKGLLIDDLNARSIEFLDGIGQEAAKEIYINGDKAHFTKKGATQMAELVAAELPRIGSPLASYLKR